MEKCPKTLQPCTDGIEGHAPTLSSGGAPGGFDACRGRPVVAVERGENAWSAPGRARQGVQDDSQQSSIRQKLGSFSPPIWGICLQK